MEKGFLHPRQPYHWAPAWTQDVPVRHRERMAKIRSKDTTPELIVRSMVFKLGYRYRLHRRNLPGTPDLVFARHKKVIDVRGCFWHAHSCLGGRRPTTRSAYWTSKLERNVARDRRNLRRLRGMGWRVLVVWECQTVDTGRLEERLTAFLRS